MQDYLHPKNKAVKVDEGEGETKEIAVWAVLFELTCKYLQG